MSCLSLQFTAAAQGMATAEEAAAQIVFVRQPQGARALVAGLSLVRLGVLYNVHRRYFPDLRPGSGIRGNLVLSVLFS